MIKIYYFASIRENLGVAEDDFAISVPEITVDSLIDSLVASKGSSWQKYLRDSKVLVAVNQAVAPLSALIKDGDEVAFFPPVTGG